MVLACLAALVAMQAEAGALSPTTTVAPSEPFEIGAMVWAQSLRDDPAFAGFTVERSTIIVAKVNDRDFQAPIPDSASTVEFVEASLSYREFADGNLHAAHLLQQVDPSVIAVTYDPFVDEIEILRFSNDSESSVEPSIVDDILLTAFGAGAEDLGYRIQATDAMGAPEIPERASRNGHTVEVTVLCEEGGAIGFRDRASRFLPMGGEVRNAWDWSCRLAPPDTTGTDRLIYALLGLVTVLAALLIWAVSRKSDLERQLWAAENPKSQLKF